MNIKTLMRMSSYFLSTLPNSAISRQAKANKFSLVFWLNEIVRFQQTFSRHGRVFKQA